MVEDLERENRAYRVERRDLLSQIDSLVAAAIKQRGAQRHNIDFPEAQTFDKLVEMG